MPVTATIIGALTIAAAVTGKVGQKSVAEKQKEVRDKNRRTAMTTGIIHIANERAAEQQALDEKVASEKRRMMWIVFGLVAVFVIMIAVIIVKRKKT